MNSTKALYGKPIVWALAAIAAVGVGCWVYQLVGGLAVTGMSNVTSWGLYITNFMFFVGLSAGGLIVASSAHVFGVEKFKGIALPAVICSTVCIVCAASFVLIDLGGIQRVWRIVTGANFASPLVWDMCVITIYLVINILDIVFIVKKKERAVRRLSFVALPVAILVHSVTAWIFGLEIAREGWYSAIMAPIFVASACDSGLALLILSLVGLRKVKLFELSANTVASLSRLLATFIAVDAYLIGCELLTMAYPGGQEAATVLATMTTGATAPFFWFEIIGGLLVPFLVLVASRKPIGTASLVFSCVLVVMGVFCKRVWLLFSSFITPNIYAAPGVTAGTFEAQQNPIGMWMATGAYAPTAIELLVTLGVIALGVLIWMILSRKLLGKASNR